MDQITDWKKRKIHYKITSWNGPYDFDDFAKIKEKEQLASNGKVELFGIGTLTIQPRYLFNTGNLRWRDDEWKMMISSL